MKISAKLINEMNELYNKKKHKKLLSLIEQIDIDNSCETIINFYKIPSLFIIGEIDQGKELLYKVITKNTKEISVEIYYMLLHLIQNGYIDIASYIFNLPGVREITLYPNFIDDKLK